MLPRYLLLSECFALLSRCAQGYESMLRPGVESYNYFYNSSGGHGLGVPVVEPVRAQDLMFTGRVLSVQEAVDWGLVAKVPRHAKASSPSRRGDRRIGCIRSCGPRVDG